MTPILRQHSVPGMTGCAGLLLAALALSACNGAATPTVGGFSVLILDIDGPDMTVVVNGQSVGVVVCGAGSLTLIAGEAGVPSLPWTIALSRRDGSQFGSVRLSGTEGDQAIVVRSGGVVHGPKAGSRGPAPTSPCPG